MNTLKSDKMDSQSTTLFFLVLYRILPDQLHRLLKVYYILLAETNKFISILLKVGFRYHRFHFVRFYCISAGNRVCSLLNFESFQISYYAKNIRPFAYSCCQFRGYFYTKYLPGFLNSNLCSI